MQAHFADRLAAAVRRCGNPVLVGLDPRVGSLPAGLLDAAENADCEKVAQAFSQFCRDVIDVVAPLVPAVKPQAAFFEQWGPAGTRALAETIAYARIKGCWSSWTANEMTSAQPLRPMRRPTWGPRKSAPGGAMR